MLHRQQRSVSEHLCTGVPSSFSGTSCFLLALIGMPHIIAPPPGTHEVVSAMKTSLLSRPAVCAVWPFAGLALAARYPFVLAAPACCEEAIGAPPCIDDMAALALWGISSQAS